MRTTVTLDADVEAPLRQAMRERGISFKEALNLAVRAGLGARAARGRRKVRLKTYRMGFNPEVCLEKALSLAAGIEDAEAIRKLSLRK